MPFPKNVKRAADVASTIRGTPLSEHEGRSLLLRSFVIKESTAYGDLVTMECETEENEKLRLYTFSQVIADQCRDMTGRLPLIIVPATKNNYMVIF
ncbi:unnamed protein product [marine sediment metagenome]|uniref:Uncharacterized protein n=1 Tax=marine sediment metagenome TaxID=412755 RepID=X1UVV4_9ZZZZ